MYERTVKLKDNEQLAKINQETGELTELPSLSKTDRVMFKHNSPFQRYHTKAWLKLRSETKDDEFLVATHMAMMAKAYTNSLEPLSDETSMRKLSLELNTDRRKVEKLLKVLFNLGVYAKFHVVDANKEHTKYWVFNPYLSFNGKTIDDSVVKLFSGTTYAQL